MHEARNAGTGGGGESICMIIWTRRGRAWCAPNGRQLLQSSHQPIGDKAHDVLIDADGRR
jgi:hypothetical protein